MDNEQLLEAIKTLLTESFTKSEKRFDEKLYSMEGRLLRAMADMDARWDRRFMVFEKLTETFFPAVIAYMQDTQKAQSELAVRMAELERRLAKLEGKEAA